MSSCVTQCQPNNNQHDPNQWKIRFLLQDINMLVQVLQSGCLGIRKATLDQHK